jgi:hypothetical protein
MKEEDGDVSTSCESSVAIVLMVDERLIGFFLQDFLK